MGALWMLALCTGRRESELLGLRWTEIAWERGEIRVERQLKRLYGSCSCGARPETIVTS